MHFNNHQKHWHLGTFVNDIVNSKPKAMFGFDIFLKWLASVLHYNPKE